MNLVIDVNTGSDGSRFIELSDIVARLRLDFFKEFPYLYRGDIESEKKYLEAYLADERSMIVVAKIDNELAGVFTGLPLVSNAEIVSDVKDLVVKNGDNPADYYYYGDILILPKYRQLGLTRKMFAAQDKMAQLWKYKYVCALTVVRSASHPLAPASYKSYDKIWNHLGLLKTGMRITHHWPTIQPDGSVIDTNNEMEFLSKSL